MVKLMDMVFISGLMENSLMVNGKKVCDKEKVFGKVSLWIIYMWEIGKETEQMV
jgi:hypothetical protein